MVTEPESMDQLIYFTNRNVGEGHVMAWVYKGRCPKCKKGSMGKPKDEKTGKVKIRAKEYECDECGNIVPKEELEPTLEVEVKYTCPACKKSGETTTPYKRKTFQGVKAIVFKCEDCGEKIPITKKLADTKK